VCGQSLCGIQMATSSAELTGCAESVEEISKEQQAYERRLLCKLMSRYICSQDPQFDPKYGCPMCNNPSGCCEVKMAGTQTGEGDEQGLDDPLPMDLDAPRSLSSINLTVPQPLSVIDLSVTKTIPYLGEVDHDEIVETSLVRLGNQLEELWVVEECVPSRDVELDPSLLSSVSCSEDIVAPTLLAKVSCSEVIVAPAEPNTVLLTNEDCSGGAPLLDKLQSPPGHYPTYSSKVDDYDELEADEISGDEHWELSAPTVRRDPASLAADWYLYTMDEPPPSLLKPTADGAPPHKGKPMSLPHQKFGVPFHDVAAGKVTWTDIAAHQPVGWADDSSKEVLYCLPAGPAVRPPDEEPPVPIPIAPQSLKATPRPVSHDYQLMVGPTVLRQYNCQTNRLVSRKLCYNQLIVWLPFSWTQCQMLMDEFDSGKITEDGYAAAARLMKFKYGFSVYNGGAMPAGWKRFLNSLRRGTCTMASLYHGRCRMYNTKVVGQRTQLCRKTVTNFDRQHGCTGVSATP